MSPKYRYIIIAPGTEYDAMGTSERKTMLAWNKALREGNRRHWIVDAFTGALRDGIRWRLLKAI